MSNIGQIRRWLHFDGVDDYVEFVNGIETPQNLTLFVYFTDMSNEDWAIVIGNPECISNCGSRSLTLFSCQATSSGYYQYGFGDGNAWISDNKWIGRIINDVFIVRVTNSELEGRVGDGTWQTQSISTLPAQNHIKYIGINTDKDKYFKGNIYFIALYNRALSDAEISQLYDYIVNGKGEMITDGLVLWLDGDSIDEASGVWIDKSGNGNDGTIYGAEMVSNSAYRTGRSWLKFDGVDDYVSLAKITDTNEFTAIAIVKSLSLTQYNDVYMFWGSGSNGSDVFQLRTYNTNGNIDLQTTFNGTWTDLEYSGIDVLNKEIFLAGVVSVSENRRTLYINGENVAQDTVPNPFDTEEKNETIGAYYSSQFHNCNIYFVALYNRPLSDEEIKQVYDYVVKGEGEMITDGLILWLDGDSIGDDGVWYDKSGNGNDGKIHGAMKVREVGEL